MISFLKLVRYKNLLMILLTMALTKYAIIEPSNYSLTNDKSFIFLSVLILFIASSGYIINDIFDVEADKINRPKRVYISNTISAKSGWKYYWSLISLITMLSFLFSSKLIHWIVFLGTPIVLFLYSKYLKKILLLGNFTISILSSIPIYIVLIFDYQPTIVNNASYIIWGYMFFAFLTTLIREIIKDTEDVDGDLKIKAKTLPIILGRERASKIAFFFASILLIFLLTVLPFFKNKYLFLGYTMIFILIPLLYFMHQLWTAERKKDFSKLSNHMKIIMLFGILSMLLIPTQ